MVADRNIEPFIPSKQPALLTDAGVAAVGFALLMLREAEPVIDPKVKLAPPLTLSAGCGTRQYPAGW
jgi:hypothetical protein